MNGIYGTALCEVGRYRVPVNVDTAAEFDSNTVHRSENWSAEVDGTNALQIGTHVKGKKEHEQ